MKHLAYIIACLVILFIVQIVKAQGDVKIGTQVWTSKNLDVSTFRNGEAIPEAKNAKQWDYASNNKTASFCYYKFDSNNGKVYGKLYNWYAVNDSRGLAPKGYHIPSDAEWNVLTNFLGGENIAGQKMKNVPRGYGFGGLIVPNFKGTGSSGFNGLPGGGWDYDGSRYGMLEGGHWWSSSENDINFAWTRGLSGYDTKVHRRNTYMRGGFSVRCIKD